MSVAVAFVYVASYHKYYAYADGACVGQIHKRFDGWIFSPDPSATNIFPPPQLVEIRRACAARTTLLNLTARMLK